MQSAESIDLSTLFGQDRFVGIRVLILNASIGGGHTSTATALAGLLRGAGAEVAVADPLSTTGLAGLPGLYARLARSRVPVLWAAYYHLRRLAPVRRLNGRLLRRLLLPALDRLAIAGFDIVVVTHHMYCHCLAALRGYRRPVAVVVTDLFGGPAEWFEPGADRYVVPSVHMRAAALRRGRGGGEVIVRRLPTRMNRKVTSKLADPRRVLVVGGTDGAGPLRRIAAGLAGAYRVTLLCGTNERLRKALPGVEVIGYVDDLPARLGEYDVVVTKPGSVTIQELVDGGVPFALLPGIPGIEHGNARTVSRILGLPVVRTARGARRIVARAVPPDALDRELPSERLSLDDLTRLPAQDAPRPR